MINNRIFGSTIDEKVQLELKKRQGETTVDVFETRDGKADFYKNPIQPYSSTFLNERTPFIRMWTSLMVVEKELFTTRLQENASEISSPYNFEYFEEVTNFDRSKFAQVQDNTFHVDNLENKRANPYFQEPVKITDQSGDVDKIAILSSDAAAALYSQREIVKQIGKREIYILGDDKYNELYASPNRSVLPNPESNTSYGGDALKPPAGITSVTSETEGTLGTTKSTTINFVVHNFNDFDKIYNKYFLRPGAQVFIDFGWSNAKLYKPDLLIESKNKYKKGIEEFLYGETSQGDGVNGIITKNNGNLEVVYGIVVDYNAKILKNGSVECSLKIVSGNSALLDSTNNKDISTKVDLLLGQGMYYAGLKQHGDVTPPNENTYDTSVEDFEVNSKNAFKRRYGDRSGEPGDISIQMGFFSDGLEGDDEFITWGRFEDFIINPLFGHGQNETDIENNKNFQIRMNSSQEFSMYENYYFPQKIKSALASKGSHKFVFPSWWGDSNPDKDSANSYTFQKQKYPDLKHYGGEGGPINTKEKTRLQFDLDSGKNTFGRIPLREVFIKTSVIKGAFNGATSGKSSVKKVIKKILEEINNESEGLFNWALTNGYTDSELKVVDRNYALNYELQNIVGDKNNSIFFNFNIMSPNSIVKDYDLEFKLPSGNIGNMLSVQAMSHGDSIESTDLELQDLAAIDSVNNDNLSIVYEPNDGSYQTEEKNLSPDGESFDIYNQVDQMLSDDDIPIKVDTTKQLGNLYKTTQQDGDDDDNKSGTTDQSKINDAKLRSRGIVVAKDLTEYHRIAIGKELAKSKYHLLPYTLTLNIYGISTILPGDTFTVDYLPKDHLENTFLQTTKVSHNVDSTGWYTTLETQYRSNDPNKKNNIFKSFKGGDTNLRIAAACLKGKDFEITGRLTYDDSSGIFGEFAQGVQGDSSFGIEEISKYMTDVKILKQPPQSKIDYLLEFRFLPGVGDIIGQNDSIWAGASTGELPSGAVRVQHYPFAQRDESHFYAAIPKNIIDLKAEGLTHGIFLAAAGETLGGSVPQDSVMKAKFRSMSFGDAVIDKFELTGPGQNDLDAEVWANDGKEISTGLYYYWPPNVYLRPLKTYRMMIAQGSFAIIDPYPNWKYDNTKDAQEEFQRLQAFFLLNFGKTDSYNALQAISGMYWNKEARYKDYDAASESFNY